MSDLPAIIADNRAAVARFLDQAARLPASAWDRPRAPGKWTPAQLTEHLCRAYETSDEVVRGQAAGGAPRFLRPLIRRFFLDPVLRSGRFGSGFRSPPPLQPGTAPGAAPALLTRLQGASDRLAATVLAEAERGRAELVHPIFGRMPSADYLRFQVIHTDHHRAQLPAPVGPPMVSP